MKKILALLVLFLVCDVSYAQQTRTANCLFCRCGQSNNQQKTDPALLAILQQIASGQQQMLQNQAQILALLQTQKSQAPQASTQPTLYVLNGNGSGQTPIQQFPIGQAPIQQFPIGQAPIQQFPIGQTPIQAMPIHQVPIQVLPIGPAPIQPFTPAGQPTQQLVPNTQQPTQQLVPNTQQPTGTGPLNPVPQQTPKQSLPIDSTVQTYVWRPVQSRK